MKHTLWEFERRQDGTYAIARNKQVVKENIPEEWFRDELGKFGFCGEEAADIRHTTDQSGRCVFDFPASLPPWLHKK